jgi:alkylation response protein AidB-like acyl-CoA dehydrogenase
VNFDLSDEQQVVRDLAASILGDHATTERVKAVEAGDGFDRALWHDLAAAGLLGACLPTAAGGSDLGAVGLALVAEQQGRNVAPVPLVPCVVAAMGIAELASRDLGDALLPGVLDGSSLVTMALAEWGENDPGAPAVTATFAGGVIRLRGSKPAVAAAQHADHVLVPARRDDGTVVVAVVDLRSDGVHVEPVDTTNHEPQAHVHLDTVVPAGRVIDDPRAVAWLVERALVGYAAVQLGVASRALSLTAEHVSTRQQFGRPLSAFQAVTQRAADGYITTEALRATTLNAAWRLDADLDARADVLVAAFWASEGTQQVVLAAQHLHGGVGADVDHPVHRYFLWGTQLANTLGTASSHLARLGRLLQAGDTR